MPKPEEFDFDERELNKAHFDQAALSREQEQRRLALIYAGMTDGELLKLARDPESLTEAAFEALEDELDRRHLEPADHVEQRQQIDWQKLVLIRQFRDLPEALLAKGCLESAGIECYLRDDNLVRLDWFISNFIGGIKLCVRPEDVHTARELIDGPILEGLYVHGVGLYEQPRCPKCNSLDVNFQELDRSDHRTSWRCRGCNAEWEEDEVADTAESAD